MRIERYLLIWVVLLVLLLAAIAVLKDVMLPFVAAFILAYLLKPLVDGLVRLGLGRGVAAALVIVTAGAAIILALVILTPILIEQLRQLAESAPSDMQRIRAAVETWAEGVLGARYPAFRAAIAQTMADISLGWAGAARNALSQVWTQGLALVNLIMLLLVTPVALYYLIADWPAMVARIDGWLPRANAPTIRKLAADIDGVIAAFVRGQGIVCLVLAVFYAVALSLLGLRYGLLIGIGTGLLSFVPFVGWALGFLCALGVAIAQGWPDLTLAIEVGALYTAGSVLDSALLSPRIVGPRIGLHPLWLIFALLAFSYLFGFIGTLLAVPLAAAIGVLIRFVLAQYLASPLYASPAPAAPPSPGGAVRAQTPPAP